MITGSLFCLCIHCAVACVHFGFSLSGSTKANMRKRAIFMMR